MSTMAASRLLWQFEAPEDWPQDRQQAVLEVLGPAGFDEAMPAPLRLLCRAPPTDHPAPAGAHAIVVSEGGLTAEHAAFLAQDPPALLLAARGDGGTPSPWEAALVHRLLSGGSLLPLPEEGTEAHLLDCITDLHRMAERAATLAREAGGGRNAAELAADVTYELAANALLDAPVDAEGRERYAHRRDEVHRVEPEDAVSLHLAVHAGLLFVQATDRFGRLDTRPFVRVLRTFGTRATLDVAGGGAGLGMRRMLEHSDACAVRVTPGRRTQVLCAVNLGEARRRAGHPKSLLFHVDRG